MVTRGLATSKLKSLDRGYGKALAKSDALWIGCRSRWRISAGNSTRCGTGGRFSRRSCPWQQILDRFLTPRRDSAARTWRNQPQWPRRRAEDGQQRLAPYGRAVAPVHLAHLSSAKRMPVNGQRSCG
jgi:hypothetical protein